VIEEVVTHQLCWYTEEAHWAQLLYSLTSWTVSDEKILSRIVDSDVKSWVHDYMWSKK